MLGMEICEPPLRNYSSRNTLGASNLRDGSQNFDLLANSVFGKII
jgi:hypothetical protein